MFFLPQIQPWEQTTEEIAFVVESCLFAENVRRLNPRSEIQSAGQVVLQATAVLIKGKSTVLNPEGSSLPPKPETLRSIKLNSKAC